MHLHLISEDFFVRQWSSILDHMQQKLGLNSNMIFFPLAFLAREIGHHTLSN